LGSDQILIMKKILSCIIILAIAFSSYSQQLQYSNPILSGFYPDPSICRAGNDYYLTTSTFAYFPGLPIFHSTDLVNWKQVGHAIDRSTQMDFNGAGVSRGLFAPSISYHKGLFYIVCTQIDKLGNFVITAKDPRGPWSDPVALRQVNGIDPSLFFDDNDKAYIIYNSIPPNNISMHDGHRTIRLYEFDWQNLKIVGEEKLLVNGGTDMARKPVWIEAPHIIKKDGSYYLICAEGGTGYNHSEVVFKSKSVDGPYIPFEKNPILTQRHLDRKRPNPITTTGHADFVQAPDGNWHAVFLGCRPYEGDHYNIGRETFMLPVTWKDGWPHILEGDQVVPYKSPVPMPSLTKNINNQFSGNFTFRDEFKQDSLNFRWIFLRTPNEKWYKLEKPGGVNLRLRPETVNGKGNPSFIGHRQQHLKGEVSVNLLSFTARDSNEKAGLVIFQNENHYYYTCQSTRNKQRVIELYKGAGNENAGKQPELLASQEIKWNKQKQVTRLKIIFNKADYSFWFANNSNNWILLKEKVDGRFLSTATAKGFVGSVFGLYATSSGTESKNWALFNMFEYKGDDEVFK
jgi:xylan 1,4-beta-xylosidase